MKKTIFFLLAIAFIATSCKNKNAAKTLEGTWNEVKINGVDVPTAVQDQIIFGKCKGGKKADCTLTIKDASGISTNFDYTINDKGTTLTIKECAGIVCLEVNYALSNLTDNSVTINWNSYVGDYTKQ
jgi:hypothetical protein